MNKPTVHYDPQSDVLYFLVRDGEEERFAEARRELVLSPALPCPERSRGKPRRRIEGLSKA